MASFEDRYFKARNDLIAINKIIYVKGAPLGSDSYFEIRKIAAAYAREAENEKTKS